MFDFKLMLQCKCDFLSYGMLMQCRYFVINVLGQHIGPIFKDLAVVMTYLPVLDNIPEEKRFQFMFFSANFKFIIFKNLLLELFWPWWWRGRFHATIRNQTPTSQSTVCNVPGSYHGSKLCSLLYIYEN